VIAELAGRASRILALAVAAVLCLASCSGTGEDVRVTLCKDLVRVLLERPGGIQWRRADNEMRRLEYLAVRLSFDAGGEGGAQEAMQARCFYRHDAVEDTALALSDPMSSYATSPYRMTLNGREVGRSALAEAVKQAMLKQGRELLDRVQRGISSG